MISPTYNLWLVLLSLLVAAAGCYASLSLAWQISENGSNKRRLMVTCVAVILGATTWAAHFIGMLALEFPFLVTYDVQLTLVSSLLSVLVVGIGLYVVTSGRISDRRIVVAGAALGAGFSSMHFIGMAAFQSNRCIVVYQMSWIFFSVIVSFAVAMLALWLAFRKATSLHVLFGAALLAVSICSMHYFAMLASDFVPSDVEISVGTPVLPGETLAIIVSLVVFGVIGSALLVAMPEAPKLASGAPADLETAGQDSPKLSPEPVSVADTGSPPLVKASIPVEKENRTLFLTLDDIFFIRADSHYSHVCDGREVYFCNFSLADLENKLPSDRFSRVHRSFIVNLSHVKGLEKDHNQGRLLFDRDGVDSIPVSRRRMREMHALLG